MIQYAFVLFPTEVYLLDLLPTWPETSALLVIMAWNQPSQFQTTWVGCTGEPPAYYILVLHTYSIHYILFNSKTDIPLGGIPPLPP